MGSKLDTTWNKIVCHRQSPPPPQPSSLAAIAEKVGGEQETYRAEAAQMKGLKFYTDNWYFDFYNLPFYGFKCLAISVVVSFLFLRLNYFRYALVTSIGFSHLAGAMAVALNVEQPTIVSFTLARN